MAKTINPRESGLFTNYIYKAIPLAFDDSMSYYQTLSGLLAYLQNTVIPTVNENGEEVAELHELFDELNDYVDHYFDNLDVQEEINNKLDAMTEDGTLTNLIKNYVDPIFEELEGEVDRRIDSQDDEIYNFENSVDSRIGVIDNKVDSAVSGTPRGAYATYTALTTADPDHDYIYVVAEDGKWYYYDTTNSLWTEGGIYQSSVNDQDVTLLNAKVGSLDTMTDYTYNRYFTTFTQGRVTSAFNTKFAYSNSVKNLNDTLLYFDDTAVKLLFFETDSAGVWTGRSGAWNEQSPATIPDAYEYFGVEVNNLNNYAVTSEDIANLLQDTYAVENPTLKIVTDVNSLSSTVDDLININNNYIFNKMAGVGDSLISGVLSTDSANYTNYDNSWLAFISRRYGANFEHYSTGGLTTKSWLSSIYRTQLENDEASNTYFISLGTNDKNQEEYQIGNITDTAGTNSFVGYYRQIIELIHQKNPNAVIFCMSMYDNRSVSQPYSAMVSDIADLYSYCYYIDFISNTAHTSKDSDLYANNSHFTTIGYVYVANLVDKLVQRIVADNTTDFKWFGVNN